MIVLGCNGGLHGYLPIFPTSRGASAAILIDGEVVAAVEEDRLARERLTGAFPMRAIDACLRAAGLSSLEEVDRVAYASRRVDATELKLPSGSRLSPAASLAIDTGLALVRAVPRARQALAPASQMAVERALRARIPRERFASVTHEQAHTANAFFTSPFESALCLVSTSEAHARSTTATLVRGGRFEAVDPRLAPDSLALLTSLAVEFLGYRAGEEVEVVALAAGGDPSRFRRFFALLVQTSLEGVAHVDPALLSLLAGRPLLTGRGLAWRGRRTAAALAHALGPSRRPGEPLEQRHRDIAAALEETTEHALLTSLEVLARKTGARNLCLAGNVALNPVANGAIARSGIFERVHVAPASDDSGTSVGAALHVEHVVQSAPRRWRVLASPFVGPPREPITIAQTGAVDTHGVRASRPDALATIVARAIVAGKIVGWCEGRSEWGSDALGHRSLLADARSPEVVERVRAIKGREGRRPFAAAVLADGASELFDLSGVCEGASMGFAVPVRPAYRDALGAVTCVDGTARVQSVTRASAPSLHAILEVLVALTDVPVVLQTSLNANDEPMLETPEDAIHFFLSTGVDVLVVDGVLFEKIPVSTPDVVRRRVRSRVGRPVHVRLVLGPARAETAPNEQGESVSS